MVWIHFIHYIILGQQKVHLLNKLKTAIQADYLSCLKISRVSSDCFVYLVGIIVQFPFQLFSEQKTQSSLEEA